MNNLVDVEWLSGRLDSPRLRVIEARLGKPVNQVAGAVASDELGISGSVVANIDADFSDPGQSLPHMMPSDADFSAAARRIGIHEGDEVVIYDRMGIYASPRLWTMFSAMGHRKVAILDGGLPAWLNAGLPVAPVAARAPVPGDFEGRLAPLWLCEADRVASALDSGEVAVIDARPKGRFNGEVAEPRQGLRSGHMPGALNVPFEDVLEAGLYRKADDLAALFRDRIGDRRKLIFSCGSGVTACIVAFAARLAGYTDIAIYDGSWSEWGASPDRPCRRAPVEGGVAG